MQKILIQLNAAADKTLEVVGYILIAALALSVVALTFLSPWLVWALLAETALGPAGYVLEVFVVVFWLIAGIKLLRFLFVEDGSEDK